MGRGTLGEVLDGLGDPRGGSGQVVGPSVRLQRVGGPSGKSGTGRGTLREIRNGSGDSLVGLVRVGGPSGRFEMGRGTLGEVLDRSGDPRGGP